MPKPWTDAEAKTATSMRGKHTNREIAGTLDKSVGAVESFFKREDAKHPGAERPNRMLGGATTPKVSSGIASRLGVDQSPDHAAYMQSVASSGRAIRSDLAKRRRPEPDNLEPVLIVADAHIPYESKVWWDLLMQVGRYLKPQHIVIIGDFADFYSVSDHDKDPDRANRMDAELAEVDKRLDELDALGAADKLYIEGNHEDRLRRYLMKNPALARVVSTEKLLKLRERGWEFVPYKRHAARGAVHFTHDVGAAGRNAVFRALDVYGGSIVSGHTHRAAMIVEGTAIGGSKISATFGWGGDVEQVDYTNLAKARKDWALAFGCGYLDPSTGFVYLQMIPVVEKTVCVNGRLFRSEAA